MTLDLLLLFIVLCLVMLVISLRKPLPILALLTIAQWHLGQQLYDSLTITYSTQLTALIVEFALRLGLPVVGLLLLSRSSTRFGAAQFLTVVAWSLMLAVMMISLLGAQLSIGGGYLYGLAYDNLLYLQAAVLGLAFGLSLSKRRGSRRKHK